MNHALLLALLPIQGPAPLPRLPRNVVRPALPIRLDLKTQRSDLIVVKFAEGVRVRLADGGQLVASGVDLTPVQRLLDGLPVQRLFTRPVATIDRETDAINRAIAAPQPLAADLNNYYHVATRGRAHSEDLLAALLAQPLVETCYAEFAPGGIVPLGDIPPTTPLYEGNQAGYMGPAAAGGHEYRACRNIVGARGHRPGGTLLVAQLEGMWVFDHEDCDNLVLANVIGTNPTGSGFDNETWKQHGTACVGFLNAGRNGYGVRGFASAARLAVCSLVNGGANMVDLVAARAQAGDVLTSSFAYGVGSGGSTHAPRDWPQADFDAVSRASARGIVYTFGAGNTATNLSDPVYGGRYTNPVQSGGVIVGASDCASYTIAGFSNRGARIDCHSWGGCGTTIGYGGLFNGGNDPRQFYTDSFGGTSQAGPLVAACAASLSGILQEQLGRAPAPGEIANLLRGHGQVVAEIGPRPDLKRMLAALGLPDGLDVTVEGSIGNQAALEVRAAPGRTHLLLLAGARGRTPTPFNRPLLIAPEFVVASVGQIGPAGTRTVTLPIPNSVALRGIDFYLQNADFGPTVDVHLSNSVELYIP